MYTKRNRSRCLKHCVGHSCGNTRKREKIGERERAREMYTYVNVKVYIQKEGNWCLDHCVGRSGGNIREPGRNGK